MAEEDEEGRLDRQIGEIDEQMYVAQILSSSAIYEQNFSKTT